MCSNSYVPVRTVCLRVSVAKVGAADRYVIRRRGKTADPDSRRRPIGLAATGRRAIVARRNEHRNAFNDRLLIHRVEAALEAAPL